MNEMILIGIFCDVDDFVQQWEPRLRRRLLERPDRACRRERSGHLSCSEVMTIWRRGRFPDLAPGTLSLANTFAMSRASPTNHARKLGRFPHECVYYDVRLVHEARMRDVSIAKSFFIPLSNCAQFHS